MHDSFFCWSLPNSETFHVFTPGGEGVRFRFAPFSGKHPSLDFTGTVREVARNELHGSIGTLPRCEYQSTSSSKHQQNVAEAVKKIFNGELDKVVLSTLNVLPCSVDPFELIKHLRHSHPGALVYLVSHPLTGCWAGATPEPLVVGQAGEFETVSLAGTRVHELGVHPWGQKESLEQSIVTDYIKKQLRKADVTDLKIQRPETIRYGNLEHLRSTLRFKSMNIDRVIGALHPTPAVCGVPMGAARLQIGVLEDHDRKYYTGYVHIERSGAVNCFVNLRCMEIFSDAIAVYSGGGITAESDPNDEWRETRDKIRALLNGFTEIPA
jgi:isochorismate synthase